MHPARRNIEAMSFKLNRNGPATLELQPTSERETLMAEFKQFGIVGGISAKRLDAFEVKNVHVIWDYVKAVASRGQKTALTRLLNAARNVAQPPPRTSRKLTFTHIPCAYG